jgi:hypothetical protein
MPQHRRMPDLNTLLVGMRYAEKKSSYELWVTSYR